MYRKILVPVDGSDTAKKGLMEAIKLAKDVGAQLRLLHIVNELIIDYTYGSVMYSEGLFESLRKGGQEILKQAEALVRENGLEPQSVLLESIGGPAATMIVSQANQWPADLIVMGTHGRRGINRLTLGSDAETVIRTAPVPVLLVRYKQD